MGLVGGKSIPHQQLAVLRGGHEVYLVAGPVKGVNLSQMPLQGSTGAKLFSTGKVYGIVAEVSRQAYALALWDIREQVRRKD